MAVSSAVKGLFNLAASEFSVLGCARLDWPGMLGMDGGLAALRSLRGSRRRGSIVVFRSLRDR
jgi:hypothetical protein